MTVGRDFRGIGIKPRELFFVIVVASIAGCASAHKPSSSPSKPKTADPTITPVLNVPQLIGKSPADFEKVLGKAIRVTKITDEPDMMPGEYRDYKIEHTLGTLTEDGLWVRFHKGIAVHLTFDLTKSADSAEEALQLAGIDVKGVTPQVRAPLALRWRGTFNGINFKDVAALKLESDPNKCTTIQVELEK